jgi:hypothetical protein
MTWTTPQIRRSLRRHGSDELRNRAARSSRIRDAAPASKERGAFFMFSATQLLKQAAANDRPRGYLGIL